VFQADRIYLAMIMIPEALGEGRFSRYHTKLDYLVEKRDVNPNLAISCDKGKL